MSLSSLNNFDFPSQVNDDTFLEAMRSGSTLIGESNIDIDCSRAGRAKAACNSPMAVAHEYIYVITNVYRILLGIEPIKSPLLHKKKNHSTYYNVDEKVGLFGHTLAAIGMNETSKRGALHHHLCAWLGLPARVLEQAAHFPQIVKEIAAVVNSQFKAEIDQKHHLIQMLTTFMRNSKLPQKPPIPYTAPALMCRPCRQQGSIHVPNVMGHEFKETYNYIVSRTNIHSHSFTCFKGGSGKAGCRMGFPQPLIRETVPVQLMVNENFDQNSENSENPWIVCDEIIPFNNDLVTVNHNNGRITVYELQRKELPHLPIVPENIVRNHDDSLKAFLLDKIKATIQNETVTNTPTSKLVCTIMEWLTMLKGETIHKLYDIMNDNIEKRNGLVVQFNDVMTVVLGCNTSVQFLGNAQQSRNTLFYLVPYLTKDNVSLSNCIPILKKTYDDILKRKSIAEDSGTDTRFAKHMGMRLLNQLDRKMEISDTQAMAALLEMGPQVSTDTYRYLNPFWHVAFVKQTIDKQPNLMNFNDTDENLVSPSEDVSSSSDSTYDSIDSSTDSSLEDILNENDEVDLKELFIDISPVVDNEEEDQHIHQNSVIYVPGGGCARVYERGCKLSNIQIQDPYHYHFRGELLAELSRFEYYILIQIEKGKSGSGEMSGHDNNGKRGIKTAKFDFAPEHVLYHSHVQKLRVHQPTPILSDPCNTPSHPGSEPDHNDADYESFIKKADKFALFYLTLFRPEREVYNAAYKENKYNYDWEAYKSWIAELTHDDRVISYCRLNYLQNHIHGIKTTSSLRKLARQYRDRERRLWTTEEQRHAKTLEKEYNYEPINTHDTIDPEDYDVQSSMNIHQYRTAVEITSYGLDQMALIHELCPIGKDRTTSVNMSQNNQTQFDNILRRTTSYDLNALATSLQEQNVNAENAEANQSSESLSNVDILRCNITSEDHLKRWLLDKTMAFMHHSIEKNGAISLGASQLKVIQYWINFFCTAKAKKILKRDIQDIPQILLLGLPGTGKSFVINAITECVSFLNLGEVLKAAHFGVAAMNIAGFTIHKLFRILFNEGSNCKRTLNDQQLLDMQRSLKSKSLFMIIIDEISTIPPFLLQRVNSRLKQLRGIHDKPFGGLAVMLVGDFLQKRPPGSVQLVEGLMHLVIMDDINRKKEISVFHGKGNYPYETKVNDGFKEINSNNHLGLTLFETFHLFRLKEQQRASDDEQHMKFLEKLSQPDCKISMQDFDIYQNLCKEDMENEFMTACFIVATNRERHNICFHMAKLFSIRNNCPVIRWRLPVKGWMNRPNMAEEADLIDKDPLFYDHFVKGMDGYITDNINVSLMIGNGTKFKFHSLSFHNEEQEKEVDLLLRSSQPGDIITLDFEPLTVNAEIYQEHLTDEVKKKLVQVAIPGVGQHKIVIPIFKMKKTGKLKPMPTIFTSKCFTPSRVYIRDMFPLQLGAAMTVDKAQGRTIEKVVACLSCRGNAIVDMDINSIFVALSRVKKRSDLRLLIHQNKNKRTELQYIKELTQSREYFDYLKGFRLGNTESDPMIWDRNIVLTYLADNRKS